MSRAQASTEQLPGSSPFQVHGGGRRADDQRPDAKAREDAAQSRRWGARDRPDEAGAVRTSRVPSVERPAVSRCSTGAGDDVRGLGGGCRPQPTRGRSERRRYSSVAAPPAGAPLGELGPWRSRQGGRLGSRSSWGGSRPPDGRWRGGAPIRSCSFERCSGSSPTPGRRRRSRR
jgi:hypothetical protein